MEHQKNKNKIYVEWTLNSILSHMFRIYIYIYTYVYILNIKKLTFKKYIYLFLKKEKKKRDRYLSKPNIIIDYYKNNVNQMINSF